MPNLSLRPQRDPSIFRRIAIGTWRTAYDPQVYGSVELRMEPALAYIEAFRARTGRRLTVTHMVAKAVAHTLQRVPEANAVLRWNRVYLRDRIGVFLQVVLTDEGEGKIDLSGATIYDVERKSLVEICDEVEQKVAVVRKRQDPALEKSRGLFRSVPYLLLNRFLDFLSFVTVTLNLDLRWAGIPSDPFGSVMVTNIGSLGLDMAYAPLVPYSRVPIVLAVGAVKDEAVVDGGRVVPGKVMRVHATFDHRFIDGWHAAVMSRTLKTMIEDPERHFGVPGDPRPAQPTGAPAAAAAPSPPP